MPQLMSSQTAGSVKQVSSPSDYYCMTDNMKSCQPQAQCSTNQQMQMVQMQQPLIQPVYPKYQMPEQQMLSTSYIPFPERIQNNPFSSSPQQIPQNIPPSIPSLPPSKRPRQASASAVMQHPTPQPQLPAYPSNLSRQLSSNELAYGQIQPGAVPGTNPSPRPRTSPVSPIQVHIPSPKKINYVPNSADVVISTPQVSFLLFYFYRVVISHAENDNLGCYLVIS